MGHTISYEIYVVVSFLVLLLTLLYVFGKLKKQYQEQSDKESQFKLDLQENLHAIQKQQHVDKLELTLKIQEISANARDNTTNVRNLYKKIDKIEDYIFKKEKNGKKGS